MGKLVLCGVEPSPAFRAVALTLNALGLDYEFKEVNILVGENQSKDFVKKNPQRTIPVLEDDKHILWDSHAISAYLVTKYAKNDALYPKDVYKRAVVDQRLHFDSGVLFAGFRNITFPLFFKNIDGITQEKIDALYEAYNFLEAFLQQDYLTGNTITIADFSAVATITSLETVAPLDPAKTPKVVAWIKRLSNLPYYEKANGKGAAMMMEMFKTKLGQN